MRWRQGRSRMRAHVPLPGPESRIAQPTSFLQLYFPHAPCAVPRSPARTQGERLDDLRQCRCYPRSPRPVLRTGDQRLDATHTMTEPEIPLVSPRSLADGEPPRVRVRVGDTVRRTSYAWSPAVLDLLRHVERHGFDGAPRTLGFDDQGREVLTFIEGEVGRGAGFIPDDGGRFDLRLPDFVWRDEVLADLGALLRAYHDAAATFPWADREWCYGPRRPVEPLRL